MVDACDDPFVHRQRLPSVGRPPLTVRTDFDGRSAPRFGLRGMLSTRGLCASTIAIICSRTMGLLLPRAIDWSTSSSRSAWRRSPAFTWVSSSLSFARNAAAGRGSLQHPRLGWGSRQRLRGSRPASGGVTQSDRPSMRRGQWVLAVPRQSGALLQLASIADPGDRVLSLTHGQLLAQASRLLSRDISRSQR